MILIGGIAGAGKSTIAREVARELGIDKVIATDVFKLIAQQFVCEQAEPYLFTTTHQASGVEGLEQIAAFEKHCNVMQQKLFNFLTNQIADNVVIVEGAQLTNHLHLLLQGAGYQVVSFLLTVCSPELLCERLTQKGKLRHSSWLQNMDVLQTLQQHLMAQTNAIIIENTNLEQTVNKILTEVSV